MAATLAVVSGAMFPVSNDDSVPMSPPRELQAAKQMQKTDKASTAGILIPNSRNRRKQPTHFAVLTLIPG
jgi:hypothetical protein